MAKQATTVGSGVFVQVLEAEKLVHGDDDFPPGVTFF